MLEFTRTEYEHKMLAGEGMPREFVLVEPDGTKTHVFLTSGAAAPVENPRFKDPAVRQAVTWLADLLEYYHVDLLEKPQATPFSDILESADGNSLEHAPVMEAMIKNGLVRLEAWLDGPTHGDHADLLHMAEKCVAELRLADF